MHLLSGMILQVSHESNLMGIEGARPANASLSMQIRPKKGAIWGGRREFSIPIMTLKGASFET